MAKFGPWIAMAFLLATGVLGVRDSVLDWSHAVNGGQRLTTILVASNALVSLAAAGALFARHRAARLLMGLWAALLTLTAGAAAYWWGEAGLAAALAGAAATAGVCFLVLWLARARSRAVEAEPSR